MTTQAEPLTHSLAACFRACPRRAQLKYEYGLRVDSESLPLKVGHAFHAAVEAAANGLDAGPAIEEKLEDPYDRAMVAAMFDGHERRWADQHLEHVAAELPFDLPLVNPETGRPSTVWRLNGKIDRIVRLDDGRLALFEFKSTSRDFAPQADYWLSLHLDMQLSIYVIAARELGYDVSTIYYDVTRRPAQRPSQVPITDETGAKIVLGADGLRVQTADKKKWRETGDAAKGYVLQTRLETPTEYAERVAAAIAADPDKHFARIEIARLDQDLDDCRADLWTQQLALREAKRTGRFYRNVDACFGVTHNCDYTPICQMRDLATRTPAGFRRVTDMHPELERTATTGAIPS